MATIQKRNDTYRIKVSCGYDNAGKQVTKSMTWKPLPGMTQKQAEKEVKRQAVLFEDSIKTGKAVDSDILMQDFIDRWFDSYGKENLRIRTYTEYQKLSVRVKQALGHIRVCKLQPRHLLDFYQQLESEGANKKTGKGLSPKTVKHYHTFLSSVLDRAVKWNIINENPCKRIDAPKVPQHQIDCLNDDEALILLQGLENEPLRYHVFFALAIYTGMRRGELLGLEWPDIDTTNGVISIRRTSQYAPEHGTFTDTTKTIASQRSIRVPQNMVDLLLSYKAWQDAERERLGDEWDTGWAEHQRLFTNLDGKPMTPSIPLNMFKRILERNGLRYVTLHSLRHTNATILIQQGVSIRAVSGRLGHSQTSTTMNIYAHQLQSADAAAAEAIDFALKPKKDKKQTTA